MDEDDKIRRNLVMFSAGVLFVAWLNVPVQGLLEDALKVKQVISSTKTWSAAAAVLVYLFLRYRFSKDGATLIEAIGTTYKKVIFQRVHSSVMEDAKRSMEVRGTSLFLGDEAQQARDNFWTKYKTGEHAGETTVNPSLGTTTGRWSGTVKLTVVAQDALGTIMHLAAYEVPYRVGGWSKTILSLRAFYRSWVYSDTSVNQLLPVLLGSAAALVITWKLASALLA